MYLLLKLTPWTIIRKTFAFILIIYSPLYASFDHNELLQFPLIIVNKFPKIGPINRGFKKNKGDENNHNNSPNRDFNLVEEFSPGEYSEKTFVCVSDTNSESSASSLESGHDSASVTYSLSLMGQGHRKKGDVFGVARITNETEGLTEIKAFTMPPADRYVGRTKFTDLTPNTTYTIQMGYIKGAQEDIDASVFFGTMPINLMS